MTTVVGVRFREVGKIYYFDPGQLELKSGDNVIVDTVRGTEFGTVMIGNRQVEDEDIVQPLKVVRRMATNDDVERVKANREKETDAFKICKEKIKERGLEMKLISAEYTFDNAKILFYFTADGRVDFRELVKDLAAIFKIRIELRQVGVRDETKLMGGLGGCGRPLCCASYLSDFVPVSIRMAKEQNLSLNPQKISGVCGRLMCCLKNEADTYEDLNTRLPKDGGKVITKDGREGIAETVNVLRERVRVLFTDEQGNRELEEFPASELQFTPRRKQKTCPIAAAAADEDLSVEEIIEEETEIADIEEEDALQEFSAVSDVSDSSDISDASDVSGIEEPSEEPAKKKRHHRHRKKKTVDAVSETSESNNAADEAKEERGAAEEKNKNESRSSREHRRKHENRENQENRENREHKDNRENREHRGNHEHKSNHENKEHKDSRENKVSPEKKDSSENEGGENKPYKPHGTYRRFRKRRPKNNTESE